MKRTFMRNPSNRISRLLILTMVLALLVGCLAGCRKQETPDESGQNPPNLVDQESTPSTDGSSAPDDETEPESTGSVSIQDNEATITAEQVNVRAAPSSERTIIDTLVKGDVVKIVDQQTLLGVTWVRIDGSGWICLDLISLPGGYVDPTDPTEPEGTEPDETQPEETKDPEPGTGTGNGNDKVVAKGIVTASELNIRDKATTNGSEIVGKLHAGDRVEILEKSNGWGRTSKGWISLDYVYQDGTIGKNSAQGVVTGDTLNIRSGPGTKYDRVDSLSHGARVKIMEQITIGGTKWGCIEKGWICLDYVYIDGTTGENGGTGTVTGDQLNIRTGPGTNFERNGSLNKGDTIKIYTQIKIGDMTWGCTDKGWVSMDYVEMKK